MPRRYLDAWFIVPNSAAGEQSRLENLTAARE